MTEQEIFIHLDKMLENAKTKNFLNHLIRAYYPIENVNKVWEKPKGPFKCVISGDELLSAQDIVDGINTEEFKNDFIENLKSVFTNESKSEHPLVKLIGEKKMGVTGTDTTTFMSYSAMIGFYNWVMSKSLMNDKHINWLLRSIKKSLTVDSVKVNNIKEEKKEKNTPASYTLGETDSFKKLKEMFK